MRQLASASSLLLLLLAEGEIVALQVVRRPSACRGHPSPDVKPLQQRPPLLVRGQPLPRPFERVLAGGETLVGWPRRGPFYRVAWPQILELRLSCVAEMGGLRIVAEDKGEGRRSLVASSSSSSRHLLEHGWPSHAIFFSPRSGPAEFGLVRAAKQRLPSAW